MRLNKREGKRKKWDRRTLWKRGTGTKNSKQRNRRRNTNNMIDTRSKSRKNRRRTRSRKIGLILPTIKLSSPS